MQMYKTVGQDMRRRQENDGIQLMLEQVRAQTKADAHCAFSSRLDMLATQASINELTSAEIVELLRQESTAFNHSSIDIKALL